MLITVFFLPISLIMTILYLPEQIIFGENVVYIVKNGSLEVFLPTRQFEAVSEESND